MTPPKGTPGLYVRGRQHLFTDSRGCRCGSLIVASSQDAREVRNTVSIWEGLHPEGKSLGGELHERVSIAEAKARQKARGEQAHVEKSRIELR